MNDDAERLLDALTGKVAARLAGGCPELAAAAEGLNSAALGLKAAVGVAEVRIAEARSVMRRIEAMEATLEGLE